MSSRSLHRRRCRRPGFLAWGSPIGWLAFSLAVLAAGEASALDTVGSGGTGGDPIALREILRSISRAGVPLIYSTATVPPELTAHTPPPDLPLDERLKWLLTPFGLEARPLPNGAYVIVHASRKLGQLAITVTLDRSGRIEPLPGASVSLIGADRHATSDARGHVEFADLAPGRYQIQAQYRGLGSVQSRVQLSAGGGAAQVELRLASVPALLEEIRIEGTQIDPGATLGRSIARETLESNPTTSSDAARTLQLMPGAAVAGYTAKTHVRGSRDDETLFRYDGLALIDPYHLEDLQSLNSALDPAVIDSATTWTSAPPIQFGGRIGAVVDLEPRSVTALITDAQLSNRDVHLTAATPFAAAQGTVLASMRMTNDSSPARWLESDSLTPNFRDYLLRTTWKVGSGAHLAAGVLAFDDQLDTLSNARAPLDQRAQLVGHERYAWLRWWQALADDISSETLISTERSSDQAFGSVVVPGIEAGHLARSDRHSAVTIRDELTFQPAENWSWLLGAELTDARVEEVLVNAVAFQPPFVPGVQPLSSLSSDEAVAIRSVARSGYGAVQWQRGGRTIVALGLRRDERQFSASAAGDGYWSANASVKQQLTRSTLLRLSWGRTTQASVLELDQGADGGVRPSAARLLTQVDAGVDAALGPHWSLRTDVYDKRERSPSSGSEDAFTPFALLPEIALGSVAVNSASARMSGVEAQLKSDPLQPLSGWLSYARSRAEDRVAGQWVPRSWDQPNAVQIGTRWSSGPWQVAGLFSWHTGWPFTPLLASSTTWIDPRTVTVGLAARNSARTASVGSLDIRVSWDHSMAHGLAQVALEINDLTNSKTTCCHSYRLARGPDGSSQLLDNPGRWLGFAPKLSFRWRM